jgi:tyrosyl-tRNA synthetase
MDFQKIGAIDAIGAQSLPADRPWRVKMGFDPTAQDLHLGHAVSLFALRKLQDLGHEVLLIVGDFTAAIGDPTGRNAMRPPLSAEQIAQNAQTYASQALLILDPAKTKILRNSQWLEPMGAAGLVSLAAQATVAQMLAREDFAKRMDESKPVGVHELLYPLLQAQDSVRLAPDIEFGGSDQRFNLLAGRELMREQGLAPQACVLMPLLPGLDGEKKMSKSLGNHIGVSEPAADLFAKTMSISDALMGRWIEAFGLSGELGVDPAERPMDAKKALARWLCAALRGPEAAAEAQAGWEAAHQRGDRAALAEDKLVSVPAHGVLWASVLRDWGWEASGSRARERIAQGALKVNGEKLVDPKALALPGFTGLVSYGAKHSARVSVVELSVDAAAVAATEPERRDAPGRRGP